MLQPIINMADRARTKKRMRNFYKQSIVKEQDSKLKILERSAFKYKRAVNTATLKIPNFRTAEFRV